MRVAFIGLRGFPNVQGGVETHAEHLCPRLAAMGCEVEVIARAPYQPEQPSQWQGVRFKRIWSPKSKGLEAVLHTFLGTLYAGLVSRPDILHIQAIGPAVMTPLAKLLGLRVVVTHHGPDYDRQKWGAFARTVLRLGERFGMRSSNARIVISKVIAGIVQTSHRRDSFLIPNGVVLPELPTTTGTIEQFGLERGKYVVIVSRLVPEKRHLDLIAAFRLASIPGWKLAIVGASDHPDAYVREVLESARASTDIVCTGLQTGLALKELYSHAAVFVLPSSHEGLPIALLEALSFGLPVIASDIPANLEVGLPEDSYFPLGAVDALSGRLKAFAKRVPFQQERNQRRVWVAARYDWDAIATRTFDVYKTILNKSSHSRGRDASPEANLPVN
ncbi:MAG: glycosyl transferase [Betaproteobacteria bacterium HGW-Betaproteobacteria-7]|jgi:glycosyltransferase involved in cell wall biosynthesis|nr:MAG: glycosyl transferase [Betaproteobacteria bacterium HGW-Betaproteobacteria-7]